MHMQPVFEGCRTIGGPVSEDLFERGLCLPSGSQMTTPPALRAPSPAGGGEKDAPSGGVESDLERVVGRLVDVL
jgi:hypothetical protein